MNEKNTIQEASSRNVSVPDIGRFVILRTTSLWSNEGRFGFTLIELLVVVLIIGILAAVAVPQYQTAVMKSRYTELMLLGNAIYKARLVHKMADGTYGTDFTQLDISLPNCSLQNHGDKENSSYNCIKKKFYCEIYDNWTHCHMYDNFLYYSILSGNGKRQCGAKIQDKIANQVCKSAGASYTGQQNDMNWYVF